MSKLYPAGGNVGVIRDPFKIHNLSGPTGLVAATRMTPLSFPDNLVLSPDNQYLYAAYSGLGQVQVFGVQAMITAVERAIERWHWDLEIKQFTYGVAKPDLHPINDFTQLEDGTLFTDEFTDSGGVVHPYNVPNAAIDVKADYRLPLDGGQGALELLFFNFDEERKPLAVGGLPRGLAAPQKKILTVTDASGDDSETTVFQNGALRVTINLEPSDLPGIPENVKLVARLISGGEPIVLRDFGNTQSISNIINLELAGGRARLDPGQYALSALVKLQATGVEDSGREVFLGVRTMTVLPAEIASRSFKPDAVRAGMYHGSMVIYGGGGTDTLDLDAYQNEVLSLNGSSLIDFRANPNLPPHQAIYHGTAFDYLRLTDGREFYFQGVERLTFADDTTTELQVRPDDDKFASQWDLAITDVPDAWRFTTGADNVLLVSLDVGLPSLPTGRGATGIMGDDLDPAGRLDVSSPGAINLIPMGGPTNHGHRAISVMSALSNNHFGISGINWSSPVRVEFDAAGGSLLNMIQDGFSAARADQHIVFQSGVTFGVDSYKGWGKSWTDLLNAMKDKAIFAIAAGNGGIDINIDAPENAVVKAGDGGDWSRLAGTHANVIAVGALEHVHQLAYGDWYGLDVDAEPINNAIAVNIAPYSNRSMTLVAPTDLPAMNSSNDIIGIAFMDKPVSGHFKLKFNGVQTDPIDWNATRGEIQKKLERLSTIGPGNVVVLGRSEDSFLQGLEVMFINKLGNSRQNGLLVGDMDLVFEKSATLSITELDEFYHRLQVCLPENTNGGTFTLSLGGKTTPPIPWGADSKTVQRTLETLVGLGMVTVSGSSPCWVVDLSGVDASLPLTGDGRGLTNFMSGIAVSRSIYRLVNPHFHGTSAANPVVAGIASLVWSINPALKAGEVRSLLIDTAMHLASLGNPADKVFSSTSRGVASWNPVFGYGLVDAGAAVRRAYALRVAPDLAKLYADDGNRKLPDLGSVIGSEVGAASLTTSVLDTSGTTPKTALSLWSSVLQESVPLQLDVSLQDLPAGELGEARIDAIGPDGLPTAGTIVLDTDAAGVGWFVDPTPLDHSEFGTTLDDTSFQASGNSVAAERYDLLTVLLHEAGHLLGFDSQARGFSAHVGTAAGSQVFAAPGLTAQLAADGDHLNSDRYANDLMNDLLSPSVRRLPSTMDAQILSMVRAAGQIIQTPVGVIVPGALRSLAELSFRGYASLPTAQPLISAPTNWPMVNADFSINDPSDPGFGWTVMGSVAVGSGAVMLSESPIENTDLSQSFSIPADARALTFSLKGIHFDTIEGVPDAFEVALLDSVTGNSLAGTDGLTHSDALLNIQANGSIYKSAHVILQGISGNTLSGDVTQPIVVTIDLSDRSASQAATIYFDLLGFGKLGSYVTIDDVRFVTAGEDQAPTAADDAFILNEDQPSVLPVLANDSDPEGNALTAVVLTPLAHGALTLNADNSFTYTPAKDFHGTDGFTYLVNDGLADSNTATVTLTVQSVNDAPVVVDGAQTTDEDTSLNGQVPSGSDVENEELSYALVGDGQVFTAGNVFLGQVAMQSAGAYTFTPVANANGTGSFQYRANDGQADSNVATVTITVTPINDAPVATAATPSGNEDTLITGSLGAIDVDGDGLTYSLVAAAANGTAVVQADGSFTYTPNANFNGSDSFTYQAKDGFADSNVATVTLTVTPVNDAPVAGNDARTTARNTLLNAQVPVATDVDGDALTYALAGNGQVYTSSGVLLGEVDLQSDGAYVFTPAHGIQGTGAFQYRANDGQADSNLATVTLTVFSPNTPPVAGNDAINTDEDTVLKAKVPTATDPDNDPLSYTLVGDGQLFTAGGQLLGQLAMQSDGAYTCTPVTHANGSGTFQYRANDGQADSNTATVTITITPVNDAPVATTATAFGNEDTLITGTLGATDVDGDGLTYSLVAAAANGTAIVQADGSFTYTPNANFNGSDSFTYKVTDGLADSNVAKLTLTVSPLNDAPLAGSDAQTTARNVLLSARIPVATDVDGDALTYALAGNDQVFTELGVLLGQVILQADGAYTFQPATDTQGTGAFQYRANDGQADSNIATVTITVFSLNAPPVAANDATNTDEDTVLKAKVPTASDPDNDPLSYTLLGDGRVFTAGNRLLGEVAMQSDGAYTFTPVANAHGTGSFTYRANDGQADSNLAKVTITVKPVNDAPTLATIADQVISEGQNLSFQIAAADIDGDLLSYNVSRAGALIDASGFFSFTALDGDASHDFIVQVSDGQSLAERRFTVTVANVAPTLSVTGAANAPGGTPYTIQLAASDPGQDTLTDWILNWGDGSSDTLPGAATEASHWYSRAGGNFIIEASASDDDSDEDGRYPATPLGVSVARDLLDVQSFTPTASGFKVRFDHSFDASTIDLYNAAGGPADVQLVGDLVGPVSGSLLLDADRRGFSFLRSGGILQFDGYSVRLASGPAGFHDGVSALDGNSDGTPGDDWLTHFDFRSTGAGVLSLPDFMRGPGQPVDVPATGKLLPVSFTSPGGLRNLVFTVDYDPRLLDITGAVAASGLPPGSEVRFESAARDNGGQRARITVILPGEAALVAGSTRLVDLIAQVPASAPYGAKEILDLSVESLNGSAVPAGDVADDDAFHLVGYFGDTSGDGAYSTWDGQKIQRVLVKLDPGFEAYPHVDPLLIADINGSGTLTSLDASRVLQEVSYLSEASSVDRLEIPPIPPGIPPLTFAGPDPRIDIPVDTTAEPGDLVTVPIRIDTTAGLESVQLRIGYDASRFDLVAVGRGSVTGDFGWFVTGQDPGRITVDMTRLDALPEGSGTLLEIALRVKVDALPGATAIDLQYARLNDGHLTLNVVPQAGADETDGRITIVGKAAQVVSTPLAEAAPVAATPLAQGLIEPQPQTSIPVAAGGWPSAPVFGSSASPVPVIDLAGSFSLPPALNQAIVADSKSKPWLKDYLGNVGQARKASPNSGLKVTIPVSPAAVSPSSRSVLV